MSPVLFWTDLLVLLVAAMALAYAFQVRRSAHLRASWRRVGESPVAVAASVFLAAFILVGLLDSVHLRTRDAEIVSVLDLGLGRLRTQVETTYSAPFATHGYARMPIETDTGTERLFPRLTYGGAHLVDPGADRLPDIAWRLVRVLGITVLLSSVLAWLLTWRLARHHGLNLNDAGQRLLRGDFPAPWRSLLVSIAALMLLVVVVIEFAGLYHILGTDKVGQDVLYQAIKSIRTGLVIGSITTLVVLPLGIVLGIAAGYFGGRVDDVIQYLYTTLNSIPGVLLIAAAVLVMQLKMDANPTAFDSVEARADLRLLALCVILGITGWTGLARLLRAETLKLREAEYIQAATSLGLGHGVILLRHVLPNVMHIVLITVVLDFSGLVLAEAILSYVGVGVDPTMMSWGNMINAARLELSREPVVWWSLSAAFVFMLGLVLAANLVADAVRDAFDPRLNR
ncbi:MAG: ABC transporter permease [Gammaproteobacteria bacterium]